MAAVEEIERYLAEGIAAGKIGYGDRFPSRSALASKFNTSVATVSSAFQRLSAEHDLEYVAGKGVFLTAPTPKKQLFTIGLIGSGASKFAAGKHITNGPYWGMGILPSLLKHAEEYDYAVTAIPQTHAEPIDIDRIADCDVDCLISHGVQLREETVLELRRRGIPLVLGNRGDLSLPLLGTSYVDYATTDLYHEVVRLFNGCGHQRVACVMTVVRQCMDKLA